MSIPARFLRYSGTSHRGYERDNNEDSVYAGRRLLALADGVGGHAAGEIASTLAIEELVALDDVDIADPQGALRDAAARANEAIERHVEEHPETAGMATTLTAILFGSADAALVHIGDSRAYRLSAGALTQLTKDDTLVQALVDEGALSLDEARLHPQRSVVLRVLTGHPVEPVIDSLEVEVGDRYLICSDGVSDVLGEEALVQGLGNEDPQRAAYELLQMAMRAGTRDNVSAVVADVLDQDVGYNIPMLGGAALETILRR